MQALGDRNVVLVGLPGAGKSSVGRRLGARLGVPFVDADHEIEAAAGMSITEIFAVHGEQAFREGEARVIARLLESGPQVIATGGGAFMSPSTRAAVADRGVSVWLDAPTEVLLERIVRRTHRPMFNGVDPRAKLAELRAARDPVFAQARLRVASSAGPQERVVTSLIATLARELTGAGTDVGAQATDGARS